MKVAAAQTHPRFGQPEENRLITRRFCRRAAQQDVRLIVFPELCITGYNFSSKKALVRLAEPVPNGPTTQLWLNLAKAHRLIIVGGLAELDDKGQIFNSAVVVGPKGFLGCYRKLHLFGSEWELFSAGNQIPQVHSVLGFKFGAIVCFDWAFPELARILMLEGCEVLCHPSNLVLPLAQRVMIARSIENRLFTITANRVGTERDLQFTGRSQIISPSGDILVRGRSRRSQLLITEINPAEARNKNITPTNNLITDRRVKLYKRLIS
ncbi:MAG: nitrilase-related carbon-nitrogen hydrolase [Promethearchaeota archaeon]